MNDLVARDAAAFFHQRGSSPCLAALRAVGGCWIEDADGHRMLDFHGNTVHYIGHAHPRLIAALQAQLQELPFCPRRHTNLPAVELADALLARWPGSPARVLFATGGSDAMEIALKLARVATGRHESISLEGSYHGDGLGAFGLGSARHDPRLGPLLPGRHHVTPYWVDAGRMLDEMRTTFAASPTGIAAVVLYQFGSGPIRGFAVTLGIGIICSMYTALVVTRLIFAYTYGRGSEPETMSI